VLEGIRNLKNKLTQGSHKQDNNKAANNVMDMLIDLDIKNEQQP
jgi:hypothetical protein